MADSDTGFEKGGGVSFVKFQVNGFWCESYIKKVKISAKKEGHMPPSKSASGNGVAMHIFEQ